MKSIVIFSDGNGNSASSPHIINVWRLYKALDVSVASNQIVFYDDGGVGTSKNKLLKVFGLVFGVGLSANVKTIYKFVCRAYGENNPPEENDRIYAFGFSRGAFTMRVVTALISDQGLVNPEGLDEAEFSKRIDRAYLSFRIKRFGDSLFTLPLKS